MRGLTRRTFLAASAAMATGPAFGAARRSAAQAPANADVVIVGAGAAGLAAARRLAAAGKRVAVYEAAARAGGRCHTDLSRFGMPCDLGAHWLHRPEHNPLAKLATEVGLDIYRAPPGERVRIGRRYAREGEIEQLFAALVRAKAAIGQAARHGDIAGARALPDSLGEWRATVEFLLGPFACGKDLSNISAADLHQEPERDIDAFCRQGLGTLLVRLADGLPVHVSTPVTRVDWRRRNGVEVVTSAGIVNARAVIVTVSTGVVTAEKIAFAPALPKRQREAIASLSLGSYDRVVLELAGNPFGLRADELVIEKSAGPRTAAMLGNVSGTSLCAIDIAGEFGRAVAAKGETAMLAFAREWLAKLYGADITKSLKRHQTTNWNAEPWVRGAMSAAAPGAQSARKELMKPLAQRLWFAGEAAHETLWGTVEGAWLSGERVAAEILQAFEAPRRAPPRYRRPPPRPKRPPVAAPFRFPWARN